MSHAKERARYAADPPASQFWTRRKKITATVVGLLLIPAIAIALLLFRAGISGEVGVGSPVAINWTDRITDLDQPFGVVGTSEDLLIDCSVALDPAEGSDDRSRYGDLVVTIENAWPGSWCQIEGTVRYVADNGATPPEPILVEGISFAPDVEITLDAGCGEPIGRADGNAPTVTFTITVPESAEPGSVIQAEGDAGLTAYLTSDHPGC